MVIGVGVVIGAVVTLIGVLLYNHLDISVVWK